MSILDELRRAWEWLTLATPPEDGADSLDDEPIRGRAWDMEDVEDFGGIDAGWPGEE